MRVDYGCDCGADSCMGRWGKNLTVDEDEQRPSLLNRYGGPKRG